jgi:hypothetical protein
MSGPIFPSREALQKHRIRQVEILLNEGDYVPMLFQYALCSLVLLLTPLLIPYRDVNQSRLIRYFFFSIIVYFSVFIIRKVRTSGLCNGYFVGMIAGWFLVWSTTILVFNDPQKSFKRIERGDLVKGDYRNGGTAVEGHADTDASFHYNCAPSRASDPAKHIGLSQYQQQVYRWQPYPKSFAHRLDWSLDLIFNFRGPEWNWRINTLPPLPNTVARALTSDIGSKNLRGSSVAKGNQDLENSWDRLKHLWHKFLLEYIILDIIKVIMNRDPYFWSDVTVYPVPPCPFNHLAFSPLLMRSYRLLVSIVGTCAALDFVTTLSPLTFMSVSLCFPHFTQKLTHQPLDEAWLYPDMFGTMDAVLSHGLAGAWSETWHQMFRFGFSEAARFVTELLFGSRTTIQDKKTKTNDHPRQRTPAEARSRKNSKERTLEEKCIQALVAFAVSGFIHVCGSYTQFAPTRPLSGPFLFFILQAVGVILQRFLARVLLPATFSFPFSDLPRWLPRTSNFIFVTIWLLITGPLMAEDFARGGIWHFEPVPISPFRWILGLWGIESTGDWWCWHGPLFNWWEEYDSSGKLMWWRSGLRVL